MEMGSEQVAGVLRASGSRVRLVVARAVDPAAAHASPAPVVPARLVYSRFQRFKRLLFTNSSLFIPLSVPTVTFELK